MLIIPLNSLTSCPESMNCEGFLHSLHDPVSPVCSQAKTCAPPRSHFLWRHNKSPWNRSGSFFLTRFPSLRRRRRAAHPVVSDADRNRYDTSITTQQRWNNGWRTDSWWPWMEGRRLHGPPRRLCRNAESFLQRCSFLYYIVFRNASSSQRMAQCRCNEWSAHLFCPVLSKVNDISMNPYLHICLLLTHCTYSA